MKTLDDGIQNSRICLPTNIRLYNEYIILVLMCGADVWSLTVASQRRLDAFDHWCIQHILCIPYTAHVSNFEVRSRAGRPPITTCIRQRRLKLFGHVARADQAEDHSRALRASLNPPSNWRRPRGRPRQTYQPSVTIFNTLTVVCAWLIVKRKIVLYMAEDRGNSCPQVVMMTTFRSGR